MPPTLETARLTLRTLRPDDAEAVWDLARDRAIADSTSTVPHPYERHVADDFIAARTAPGAEDALVLWAVIRRADDRLLGVISLALDGALDGAELGYWTGVPYWGQGFTTEAALAVLGHAFGAGALATVWSTHVARNVPSHRVMEKAGMRREGILRRRFRRWAGLEDLCQHSILHEEWRS